MSIPDPAVCVCVCVRERKRDIRNTGTYLVLSSYTDQLHNYISRYLRVYHHQFITRITQRTYKSKYPCVTERAKQFRIKIITKCISRWENVYSWPSSVCVCEREREREQKVFIIKIKNKCNSRWAKMSITDPPLPNVINAGALYTN